MKRKVESFLLQIAEKILPPIAFDRCLLEWRRCVNHIDEYYPWAVFFSKKKAKEKYCVVRYTMPEMGLMAAGIQYVFVANWLKKRGYIPLIDIEYAYSYKQGRLGEDNSWDICFKQPITVREAVKAPYVLATGIGFSGKNDIKICNELNGDEMDHFIHTKKKDYRKYYAVAHKYAAPLWQIRDEIIEDCNCEIGHKIQGKRVLGVFMRETFSKEMNMKSTAVTEEIYSRHPDLPTVRETIAVIKNELKDWNYDLIFLSTIFEETIILFQKEFKEKVITLNRNRMTHREAEENVCFFEESDLKNYQTAKEMNRISETSISYIKELYLLSKCDYFLGGPSSGTVAAVTLNGGKYDDIYILEDANKIARY